MLSYDAGNFFTNDILQEIILERIRCNAIVIKAIRHFCAEYVAAAAHKTIISYIVTANVKKFPASKKHNSQCRKSRAYSDFALMEGSMIVHGKPR